MSRVSVTQRRDVRWSWALLVLCAVTLCATIFSLADVLGVGGRAWYGFWDANVAPTNVPYVIRLKAPRAGGASDRAGLREGDRIDLRRQSLQARVAVLYQLLATQPTTLTVYRAGSSRAVAVTGSTVWDDAPLWKLPALLFPLFAALWFTACAFVIALRRSSDHAGQILGLALIALAVSVVNPIQVVVPSPSVTIGIMMISSLGAAAAPALLVHLSSRFGARTAFRKPFENVAYAAIVVNFVADLAAVAGILSLRWDPTPFVFRNGTLRSILDVIAWALVILVTIVAVSSTPRSERARVSWLLLPLPLAMLLAALTGTVIYGINSWYGNMAVGVVATGVIFLGALVVTYALLKRRVLDLEFVLSRTLVVATISLAIVACFALLEWLLGTVLAGVSHATGLIANAGLALVLGLSLNPIHKRVDVLVDTLLFKKRHDDERALLNFSKEAGYVTQANALLDRAMDVVMRHTDAQGAAFLIGVDGEYAAARSFGGVGTRVGQNDAAILALKTWHKPLDPHLYGGALGGALAIPMLVRGRLTGLLVLGERIGGEAYAPDEIEALEQLAHGVGSALDVIEARQESSRDAVLTGIQAILQRLDFMVERIVPNDTNAGRRSAEPPKNSPLDL